MEQPRFPEWLPFVGLAWVLFVFAVSAIIRRRSGKPVVPRVPAGALYVDKWASGRWASNCLLVTVTDEALSVVPKFPFNLGFLPEIYGLEHTIPLRSIREARRIRGIWVGLGLGNNVAVDYGERELRLRVRSPQAFIDALARLSVHVLQ